LSLPFWLYYFNIDAVEAAMARVKDAGGQIIHGPLQVHAGCGINGAAVRAEGDNGPLFVCAQLKPDQILSWPSAYNLSVPYARSLSNVSA
jgi:uncharacterized protein